METIKYIKYNGYELIENECDFKRRQYKSVRDSRLSLIIFKFTITFEGSTVNINMPVFIPKLMHHYYYILDGNKYYSIYQHVDSSTYNTQNACVLKSLLMPIILTLDKKKFTDALKNNYNEKYFILVLFKHKLNILYYYFASFGFTNTLRYFNYADAYKIYDAEAIKKQGGYEAIDCENTLYFPICKKKILAVNKQRMEDDNHFRMFTFSILNIMKKTDFSELDNLDYWKLQLGEKFTSNKNDNTILEKANTVLLSFKRILDDRTKKNLKINNDDKDNIYSLIRWMSINFENLLKKDNLSLENKRLRLIEYQVAAFNKKMSTNTYRILNSKVVNMNKLKSIFKISDMIIITDLQKSELRRYNNAVNDMDVFTAALKYSNRGPASLGENNKKTISPIFRGADITHLSRLGLNSVTASDPGMSGILSPFVKTDGLYYSMLSDTEQTDSFLTE